MAICAVASAQNAKFVNMDGTVYIRAAANSSSKVLRTWSDEDFYSAKFISASGSWYKINYRGTVGYVHCSKLQPTSEGFKGEGAVSMTSNGYARIRKSPSSSSPVIAKMPNYKVAKYLGSSGDWYKVSYNGVVGYTDEMSTMW